MKTMLTMTKVPHRDIIMNCWIGIMVDYTTKILHKGSFASRHREDLPVRRHDTEEAEVKNPEFGILMQCRGFDTGTRSVLAEKKTEQIFQTNRPAKSFQCARNTHSNGHGTQGDNEGPEWLSKLAVGRVCRRAGRNCDS